MTLGITAERDTFLFSSPNMAHPPSACLEEWKPHRSRLLMMVLLFPFFAYTVKFKISWMLPKKISLGNITVDICDLIQVPLIVKDIQHFLLSTGSGCSICTPCITSKPELALLLTWQWGIYATWQVGPRLAMVDSGAGTIQGGSVSGCLSKCLCSLCYYIG